MMSLASSGGANSSSGHSISSVVTHAYMNKKFQEEITVGLRLKKLI